MLALDKNAPRSVRELQLSKIEGEMWKEKRDQRAVQSGLSVSVAAALKDRQSLLIAIEDIFIHTLALEDVQAQIQQVKDLSRKDREYMEYKR